MMKISKFGMCFGGVLAFGALSSAPAFGQATRTWVSGVGDDANPCSRTAPCKTFAGAISKTAPGGEINCLDPGGFGGVTITKALSIVCNYTEGGILSAGAGVNGVVVNAGVNDHVYLRGIDFHGAGSAQNAVRFIAGASLTIEDSVIRSYNASNGLGVSFQPTGASTLTINNTTISNNGNAATGGGILVQPTGAGGSAAVSLNNVRVQGNANNGMRIDTTGDTNVVTGITVEIENSQFTNNGAAGITVIVPAGTSAASVSVNASNTSNNTGTGISASGSANGTIRVANTTITTNGTGVSATGGANVNSFGNNRLTNNASNGAFTGSILPGS